jgi:hypothetical protein
MKAYCLFFGVHPLVGMDQEIGLIVKCYKLTVHCSVQYCTINLVMFFQEEGAVFSPEMITSQFLHAFLVIQPFNQVIEPNQSHSQYRYSNSEIVIDCSVHVLS